jgi:hypothetical protein
MNTTKRVGLAMVLAVGTAGLAQAHHAVNSQFNANITNPFTGTLEKTYLGNPHCYLYFVRTMPDGQMQHWTFETDAVLALRRAGLSVRENFKIGDSYAITYNPALDGGYAGLMTAIKLSDGRIISMSTKVQQNAADSLLTEKKLLDGQQSGQAQ